MLLNYNINKSEHAAAGYKSNEWPYELEESQGTGVDLSTEVGVFTN